MNKNKLTAQEKSFVELFRKARVQNVDVEEVGKQAQRGFWSQMRALIQVNDASRGLELLDRLAEAIVNGDTTEDTALVDIVLLLPAPTVMTAVETLPDAPFFDEVRKMNEDGDDEPLYGENQQSLGLEQASLACKSVDGTLMHATKRLASNTTHRGALKRAKTSMHEGRKDSNAYRAAQTTPRKIRDENTVPYTDDLQLHLSCTPLEKGSGDSNWDVFSAPVVVETTLVAQTTSDNKKEIQPDLGAERTDEVVVGTVVQEIGNDRDALEDTILDENKRLRVLNLRDDLPQRIQTDVIGIWKRAEIKNVEPWRLAYPWRGRRLWYDPTMYPTFYAAHWRSWMVGRRKWWDSDLYLPLAGKGPSVTHRQEKARALRDRLDLVSFAIETWGWFGFLERFEADGHDNMIWMGGAPSRGMAGIHNYHGPISVRLDKLYNENQNVYKAVIMGATSPRPSPFSFANIPEMLGYLEAVNPSNKPDRCLSPRALARIILDIENAISAAEMSPDAEQPYEAHWLGNFQTLSTKPWQALLDPPAVLKKVVNRVRAELANGSYVPTTPRKRYKTKADGSWSDFEEDDTPTALGPISQVTHARLIPR